MSATLHRLHHRLLLFHWIKTLEKALGVEPQSTYPKKKKKKATQRDFIFSLLSLPTPQLSIYRRKEKEEKKKKKKKRRRRRRRRRTLSRERERRCIVNLSAPLFRGRKRELKGRERRTRWGRWVPRGLHEENLDALSKHNVPVRRTDPKYKKKKKKKKLKIKKRKKEILFLLNFLPAFPKPNPLVGVDYFAFDTC
jgi:hypothetical protein